MTQPHIVQSISEAGLTGAALDAAKMKKKDAAEHAEHFLTQVCWIPDWMTCAENEKQLSGKPDLSLAPDQSESDVVSESAPENNPARAA